MPEDASQRGSNLRNAFDGLRWIVRTGSPWRYLPKDFPPWEMVYFSLQFVAARKKSHRPVLGRSRHPDKDAEPDSGREASNHAARSQASPSQSG